MTSNDPIFPPGGPEPVPAHELALLRAGLCLLARRELGDPDLAEDVAQEALARTLAACAQQRLRDPTRLAAFARGVARHLIADVHRGRRRVAAGEMEGTLERIAAERPDSLQDLVGEEERALLRRALEGMSAADRELLALLYVDGLRPGEIARKLQEPAERVRKRKERALKRLRGLFQQVAEKPSR